MRRKKERKQLKEALKRRLQTCPHCGQVWMVFCLQENEENFWATMFQSKSGAVTTITLSR